MNARPEGAVIVTTPQDVALATIKKEINFCRKMKLEIIGIVENMSGFVCPCCKVCNECVYFKLDDYRYILLLGMTIVTILWQKKVYHRKGHLKRSRMV